MKLTMKPTVFLLDVDGVFTDGKFVYTAEGKLSKTFGPDDNDALCLLKDQLHIHAVSGDKRGFKITQKRIQEDMGLPLDLVSTFERVDWIKSHFDPKKVIYMGDGIFDPLVFKHVAYSIAPANAFYKTKEAANFITQARGGEAPRGTARKSGSWALLRWRGDGGGDGERPRQGRICRATDLRPGE